MTSSISDFISSFRRQNQTLPQFDLIDQTADDFRTEFARARQALADQGASADADSGEDARSELEAALLAIWQSRDSADYSSLYADDGLTDAQRYMIRNVKSLANLSQLLDEEEDEDEEDEEGKGKTKKIKPAVTQVSMAPLPESTKKGTEEGETGQATETEIIEMPDGSRVMLVKSEVKRGLYTTVKVRISVPDVDADAATTEKPGEASGSAVTMADGASSSSEMDDIAP